MVLFYLHYNFTKTDDLVTFSSVYFEPDVRLWRHLFLWRHYAYMTSVELDVDVESPSL